LVREGRALGLVQRLVESGFDGVKFSLGFVIDGVKFALEFVIDGVKFIPELVLEGFKFGIDESNIIS
jgi:hypothetical protein